MAENGIRILFNNPKNDDQIDEATQAIQYSIRRICLAHDIYHLELNITTDFHSKANVRFKETLRSRMRGISVSGSDEFALKQESQIRIYDLRHFATTMLFMDGIPDTIIRKMTGHTSAALERYKHLDLRFANQSVGRIGDRISRQIATKFSYTPKNSNVRQKKTGGTTFIY